MSLTSYRAAPPRGNSILVRGGPARPGDDLLFRALRRSTIGAEGFHGRVRDGIGCFAPRYGHQAVQALPSLRFGLKVRSELCVSSSRIAVLRLVILAAGRGRSSQSSD